MIAILARAQEETPVPPGVTIHIVQRGESLWRIAQDYGVTVEAVAALNGLPPTSGIKAGDHLLVPDSSVVTAPTVADVSSVDTASVPLYDTLHVVGRGETLFRIAQSYGLTVNDLAVANNLTDPSLIYAGQQLLIPGAASLTTDTPPGTYPAPIQTLRLRPSPLVEGDTASIILTTSEPATVSATLLDNSLTAITDAPRTTHILLFGIPVFTAAGSYTLSISVSGATQSTTLALPVIIVPGGYPTTDISIDANREELLAPAVEEYELNLLRSLTSQVNMIRSFSGPFSLPVSALMNAPFGTHRSYNGSPATRYHSGTDFASIPGSPVLAVAGGRVVLADTLNIRGNAVVLDHGWGVYTLYAHLTTIGVQLGDTVAAGQLIGQTGSTGRVTGPHLHWEVWVSGVSVDPMQWTQNNYP